MASIGLLAAATNAAASPLYRVYQVQFGFSATTLTLSFTVYVAGPGTVPPCPPTIPGV